MTAEHVRTQDELLRYCIQVEIESGGKHLDSSGKVLESIDEILETLPREKQVRFQPVYGARTVNYVGF